MSEVNKSLCRRFVEEVWNKRNMAAIDEIFAANYTEHDPGGPDFGRGPEAVRKMLNYYLTAFPDTHFTIEDIVAEGDRCVVRWTARGTHRGELRGIPPTGKQVAVTGTSVSRIANGKIVEAFVNWDTLGILQQIGALQRQAIGRAAAY